MDSFVSLHLSIFITLHISAAKIEYNTYTETITRYTAHVPQVLAKTCLLKPDEGPCRGKIPMYHFNPSVKNCTEFEWGGCQGNGNRFDTLDECTDFCLSKANTPKKRPRWCSLTFDYGYCFGALERYYYDALWKVCKKTIYSGCGGNKNNFYNKEQCDSVCTFGLGPISTKSRTRSAMKKVIIINPWKATPKRGETMPPMTKMVTTCINSTVLSK